MTPDRFSALTEPYRRELAAHCYRMVGSLADAEDLVQDSMLSAWRGIDGFEGRASLRSWLYKIATNACLDVLRQRPRRLLLAGEPSDPHAPVPERITDEAWVDPAPASFADATPASPETTIAARESVQLAFVVALQHLPASQRSALLLREVVGWSAAEVAELLDTSVASVNSLVQRARATLDERRGRAAPPPDREIVARYTRAWEAGDVGALVALLHADVVVSMPPFPTWFRGRDAFGAFIGPRLGKPGTIRIVRADGADDVVLGLYRNDRGSPHHVGHAIEVVRFDAAGAVVELHAFLEPSLVTRFGLPAQLDR